MGKKKNCFALYQGDQFVDLGTIDELSEKLKIKKATLWFYAAPAYLERVSRKKNGFENCKILIKIED